MERKYDHNASIIYVDPRGVRRSALVTAWWGAPEAGWKDEDVTGNTPASAPAGYVSPTGEPGCNLIFISGDPARKDSCGRQTEHSTSVVHKSNQPAHGNYWCWPDEDSNPIPGEVRT
jgi:hypothetical protein